MLEPAVALARPVPSLDETPLPGLWGPQGLDVVESEMIRLVAGGRLDRLGAIGQEHLGSGGKRVRARLALAAGEAFGLAREDLAPWAAAVELLHNASLVHDDVQDGDRVRRDRLAVWARHGLPQAINVGDLFLLLPTLALTSLSTTDEVRWRLAEALGRAGVDTVRGQSAEMELLPSGRFDRDAYERAALGKAGALLALPVEGAALLGGLSPKSSRRLSAPFATLGLAFQLRDDLLDLYGDKGRGVQGNDIREGKVSALVVEHLRAHPEDRGWLAPILARPRTETTDEDVALVRDAFDESGAPGVVRRRIGDLCRMALSDAHLRAVPDLHRVASDLASVLGTVLGGGSR